MLRQALSLFVESVVLSIPCFEVYAEYCCHGLISKSGKIPKTLLCNELSFFRFGGIFQSNFLELELPNDLL